MGLLQNLFKKSSDDEFKRKFKDAQEEYKIEKMIMEREKSSNERELEKIMERKRQDMIKNKLNKVRQKEGKEFFVNKYSTLKNKTTVLNEGRPMLKEKNIFKGKKSIMLGGKSNYLK